jgi:DNA polymerase zeta
VDPSESSRGTGGEWVAEARWWEEIRKRIEKERGDIEIVADGNGWEKEIMTTFESVQALWEKERKRRQHRPRETSQVQVSQSDDDRGESGRDDESAEDHGTWNQANSGVQGIGADVDEIMLSSQEMSQMVEIEEREWAKLTGENRPFENEDVQGDGDEGYFDEEEDILSEDGPPPDLLAEDDSVHLSHGSNQAKTNKSVLYVVLCVS